MRWLAKAALQQGIGALPHARRTTCSSGACRGRPAGEASCAASSGAPSATSVPTRSTAPSGRSTTRRSTSSARVGSCDSALLLGARRRAPDPRRHPAEPPARARQPHARAAAPPARRARGGRRPARARPGREADRRGRRPRGVRDRLPRAARPRATGLDAESIDFVTSTNTLEHICGTSSRSCASAGDCSVPTGP